MSEQTSNKLPAIRQENTITVSPERKLPTAKQVGQMAAVGAVALVLERGLQWLGKQRQAESPAGRQLAIRPNPPEQAGPQVTIERQRRVQVWRNGQLVEQVDERESVQISNR